MTRLLTVLTLVICATQAFSQLTQSIRGTVRDEASTGGIAYASVIILHSDPVIGTITDSIGNFTISKLPIGRYDLQISCIGYEPTIIREVTVISAKQTLLSVQMNESASQLDAVVIRPTISKEQPLNTMASVSAKMLSVEEAKRYAGGFDDPARLASAMAGVASNTSYNGIIVRGNAPKFLQWKLEGIEIPNPNHFADLNSLGGGTLTALSTQMLGNSDFMTGAFPAEYNNALSGVFDINMRTGNNQEREHTFQAGLLGIDVSSEGPFKKGGLSSYLFNYRYATLALAAPLLPEGAGSIKYQDLSFKFNFPTKKAGVFTLWAISLIDGADSKAKLDSTSWYYKDDNEDDVIKQSMGALGLSQKYFLNNNTFLKTTIAVSGIQTDWTKAKLDESLVLHPESKLVNTNTTYVLSSVINKKINSFHTNKSGILLRGMSYDILLNKAYSPGTTPQEIANAHGFATEISAYSSSSFSLLRGLQINPGFNSRYFTLNNHYSLEPRLGLRKRLLEGHSVGLAYGLHSRLERLNYYFNNSTATGQKAVNRDMDYSKAHHLILSYDWGITDLIFLKIEPYFQWLYSIPVIQDSSFSFINLKDDLFFAEKLVNTGTGKNYGIDLTLEKYLSKGYYFLATASMFNSTYRGGDGVWRNSRFNRNYVFNFLAGKEWQMGQQHQNTLSLNARMGYQGGDRYSPINVSATRAAREVKYDETNAYSLQSSPSLTFHITASYKINKNKSAHEWALKILNLTGTPDFNGYQYNFIDHTIDKNQAVVIIPNLSYKFEF